MSCVLVCDIFNVFVCLCVVLSGVCVCVCACGVCVLLVCAACENCVMLYGVLLSEWSSCLRFMCMRVLCVIDCVMLSGLLLLLFCCVCLCVFVLVCAFRLCISVWSCICFVCCLSVFVRVSSC